jgi:hypothetical protein
VERRKALWAIAGAVGSGLFIPAAVAAAGETTAGETTAGGVGAKGVLWSADPARGTKVFDGIEESPGRISVGTDPLGIHGASFRYDITDNGNGTKERCESRGMRGLDGKRVELGAARLGQAFYLGWRSLWTPLPIAKGRWTALYQMHVSGVPSGGLNVGPFVLRTLGDGQLHFQHISPDGSDRHIWNTTLPVNSWHTFVIGFRLSTANSGSSAGWVEFWYDGKQQTFTNGSTRYTGATLWGSHVNVKWGVYRSGANKVGHSVAYLNGAKLGTTYAAVAP